MKRKATDQKGPALKKRATKTTSRRKSASVKIGEELKFNDVAIATDASTTETVIALTTFAAGDTVLLRDGNKVICKSLELRINVSNESLTQNNTVRFAVIQAKQANAAAPTWFVGNPLTDVFDQSTTVARRNTASASKFKVILDHTMCVNQGSGTGGALQQDYWHKWVRLPDEVTQFADNTSAIPTTNAYFLMYVGSTASGATDLDVQGTARIRFVG
jgi:hypothetical protein